MNLNAPAYIYVNHKCRFVQNSCTRAWPKIWKTDPVFWSKLALVCTGPYPTEPTQLLLDVSDGTKRNDGSYSRQAKASFTAFACRVQLLFVASSFRSLRVASRLRSFSDPVCASAASMTSIHAFAASLTHVCSSAASSALPQLQRFPFTWNKVILTGTYRLNCLVWTSFWIHGLTWKKRYN